MPHGATAFGLVSKAGRDAEQQSMKFMSTITGSETVGSEAATPPKTPASMTAGELVGAVTPLPWRAVNGIDRWRVENDQFYVCAMADNGLCGQIDAELIVRAVGAFGAMHAALEDLQADLMRYQTEDIHHLTVELVAEHLDGIAKALALANGGGL